MEPEVAVPTDIQKRNASNLIHDLPKFESYSDLPSPAVSQTAIIL